MRAQGRIQTNGNPAESGCRRNDPPTRHPWCPSRYHRAYRRRDGGRATVRLHCRNLPAGRADPPPRRSPHPGLETRGVRPQI